MRHFIKCLFPLCMLSLAGGCTERESAYEEVEVGEDPGELAPVENKPDGTLEDQRNEE